MPQRTAQGFDGSQSAKPAAPPNPPEKPPANPPPAESGGPDFVERHDDPKQAEELERQQDA